MKLKKKTETMIKVAIIQLVFGLLIGVFDKNFGGAYLIGAGITVFLYEFFGRKR